MVGRSNGGESVDGMAGRPVVDRFLGRLGLDRLDGTGRLPISADPLTWYAVGVVVVGMVMPQGYNLLAGRPVVFAQNPLLVLQAGLLIGAAWATGWLHRRYDRAMERSHLPRRTDRPDRFDGLVPDRLSVGFIAVGMGFTLVNAVVIITLPTLYAAGGPVRVFRFVVVATLGHVPVLATFLATYLSIEVLLPRRLERSDVRLDYLDPENLGGMRPIGELIKVAYYLVMLGLVVYAVALYGPFVLEGALAYTGLGRPGPVVNVAFTAVWALAVGTMGYGIHVLHRFMATEKRETLHRLDTAARELIDQPWDIEAFDAGDPPPEYETYRARVRHVTATKEYPATFTMWTQLLVGVMIPKAIQFALSVI